jgi:hypothetical protein
VSAIDSAAIKAQARKVGDNWDLIDQGAFAGAAFQEMVMELARLCHLCAKPVGACKGSKRVAS